jgi:hypothetical protein
VETLLRLALVACSALVMLLFVIVALMRIHYPYELEELEGSVFLTALRVFHGQAIYGPPSLDFIPYMYPPGYYFAAAGLGRMTGMTISTLRALSIVSTLGCFGVIAELVWTETRRVLPAIAAAGLYAGCYTLCAEWFDLGRLDSMFVLLVLLALYATRRAHPVVAAIVWVLAFQTKQSILPIAVLMLCCDWRNTRRTLSGLVTLLVGVAGSIAWLDHATHGWYSFYVFAVPRANADISLRSLAVFWPSELFRPLLLALVIVAAAAVFTRPSLRSVATRVYLAACAVVPVFWIVFAHGGSTANAMMPVYALLAVLFGISVARLLAWLPSIDAKLAVPATLLLLAAACAQEAAGVYNPGDYRPYAAMRSSVAASVQTVQALPGEVWVTQHPYYAWLAGKPTHADLVSIHDAMRAADPTTRAIFRAELQSALDGYRFSTIVLDQPGADERLDAAAQETAWQACYTKAWRIPNTEVATRPDWLLTYSDDANCRGPAAAR